MSIVGASQILLWLAILGLTLLVAALARQVGILHERIAPAGALTLHQRVNVGDRAPVQDLHTIGGQQVRIAGPRDRSQLLLFVSPDCPICKTLLPMLHSAARSENAWLDTVIASDGDDEAAHRRLIMTHNLTGIPYVLSEALGRTFGVSKLPYAVLLDETGRIASLGLINNREHLESLFEAKERGVASIQEYLARA